LSQIAQRPSKTTRPCTNGTKQNVFSSVVMLTVSDGYALVPFVCMWLPCYSKG